jgi:hypothetical protein
MLHATELRNCLCYYEAMVKKLSKQQLRTHQKQHRIIVGLSIVVVAALLGLSFALIVIPRTIDNIRLHRINEIYSSIKLPTNTHSETDMIFGDKRPYSYDTSRSQASEKTFVVGKSVTDTFNDLDSAIKVAGYTAFEEAYPGSVAKEEHYKTSRGEYIRLNVVSKFRNDAFQNSFLMIGKYSAEDFKIDPNVGPSTVTLKVNLDDNNE